MSEFNESDIASFGILSHPAWRERPILEMVTEKYLLREEAEWRARHTSMEILDDLLLAIRRSEVKTIARLVTRK